MPPEPSDSYGGYGGVERHVLFSAPRHQTQVCFRQETELCTQECATGSASIGMEHYILSADTGVAAANPALTLDA
jgi:hypothetical protein